MNETFIHILAFSLDDQNDVNSHYLDKLVNHQGWFSFLPAKTVAVMRENILF